MLSLRAILPRLALAAVALLGLLGAERDCNGPVPLTDWYVVRVSPAEPDVDDDLVAVFSDDPRVSFDDGRPRLAVQWYAVDADGVAEAVPDLTGPVVPASRTWAGSRWRVCVEAPIPVATEECVVPVPCADVCVAGGACGTPNGSRLAFAWLGDALEARRVADRIGAVAGPVGAVLDLSEPLDPAALGDRTDLAVWMAADAVAADPEALAAALDQWTALGHDTLYLGSTVPLVDLPTRPLDGLPSGVGFSPRAFDLATGAPHLAFLSTSGHDLGLWAHPEAELQLGWEDGEPLLAALDAESGALVLSLNLHLEATAEGDGFATYTLLGALQQLIDGRVRPGGALTGALDPLPPRIARDVPTALGATVSANFPMTAASALLEIDGALVPFPHVWTEQTPARWRIEGELVPRAAGAHTLSLRATTDAASQVFTAPILVNEPPEVELALDPAVPAAGQDLRITWQASDADGDALSGRILVNGVERDGVVPRAEILAGEALFIEVLVEDGLDTGRASARVVPTPPDPAVSPLQAAWTEPAAGRIRAGTAAFAVSFPDLDLATADVRFVRAADGLSLPAAVEPADEGLVARASVELLPGEVTWQLLARDASAAAFESRRLLVNHPPPAPAATLPGVVPGTDALLQLGPAVDLDGDPLALEIRWTDVLTGAILAEGPLLPGAHVAPGRELAWWARYDDGWNPGPAASAAFVVPADDGAGGPVIDQVDAPSARLPSGAAFDVQAAVRHPGRAVQDCTCALLDGAERLAEVRPTALGECLFEGLTRPDGPHALRLTVTDPVGRAAEVAVPVHLNRPPLAPTVAVVDEDTAALLVIEDATDADGDPMRFSATWARDDAPDAVLSTLTRFVAPDPDTAYRWSLRADDGFDPGPAATGVWRSAVRIPEPTAYFPLDTAGVQPSEFGAAYLFVSAPCGAEGQVGAACRLGPTDYGEALGTFVDPGRTQCVSLWLSGPFAPGVSTAVAFRDVDSAVFFGLEDGRAHVGTVSPTDPYTGYTAGPALGAGWHHLAACVRAEAGGRSSWAWVDGQPALLGGAHEPATATAWEWAVGTRAGGPEHPLAVPFTGAIDELAWWEGVALDDTLAAALYARGLAGRPPW